jgi:hypothetical protein
MEGKPIKTHTGGYSMEEENEPWRDWDWGDTISCIELEMKRSDWMRGEPRGDGWDGSVDNQERILEDHVGKMDDFVERMER